MEATKKVNFFPDSQGDNLIVFKQVFPQSHASFIILPKRPPYADFLAVRSFQFVLAITDFLGIRGLQKQRGFPRENTVSVPAGGIALTTAPSAVHDIT